MFSCTKLLPKLTCLAHFVFERFKTVSRVSLLLFIPAMVHTVSYMHAHVCIYIKV